MSALRVTVAALAVVLFAACGGSEPESGSALASTATPISQPTSAPTAPPPTATAAPPPTATPTAVPTATPSPPPATVSPPAETGEEILISSLLAMAGVRSLHFELEAGLTAPNVGITTEIPVVMTGDYQAPDRMKATTRVSLGLFEIESQTVIIGDTIYASDPVTGEWEAASVPALLLLNPLDFVGSDALDADNFAGVTLLGLERLQGLETLRLSSAISGMSPGQDGDDVRVEIWIGVEDRLVLQIKLESEVVLEEVAAGLTALNVSGKAQLRIMMTLSNFNAPVEIEAPDLP